MATPIQVTPRKAAADNVPVAGQPVTAIYGPVLGGMIVNPVSAEGQGLDVPTILWVDMVNPAVPYETATCFPVQPGQTFIVPKNCVSDISVTSGADGHRFSAITVQPKTPYPPEPPVGPFPPSGPSGMTKAIPSYLYEQYQDDEDLLAWVAAFNQIAQQYVNWFNETLLPVYTLDVIAGTLLDWVANGLYGVRRPALSSGKNKNIGPFNTWYFNQLPYNGFKIIGPQNLVVTTDDVFKRIVTWGFFKGDGRYFNIRWLKRRIMRFLNGINGTAPNIENTYQISVTFGVGNQVNINLLNGVRTVTRAMIFNRFGFNQLPYNALESTFTQYALLANAQILKEAIESGALELPFQYDYVVSIQG